MSRPYQDRRLAIMDHAVTRLRERVGAVHLPADECRWIIARTVLPALQANKVELHYVPGQYRTLVDFMGVQVYAIIGHDEIGWADTGIAITTILTPEQVRQREARTHAVVAVRTPVKDESLIEFAQKFARKRGKV